MNERKAISFIFAKLTSKTLSAFLIVMQMILVHRNENYGSGNVDN